MTAREAYGIRLAALVALIQRLAPGGLVDWIAHSLGRGWRLAPPRHPGGAGGG